MTYADQVWSEEDRRKLREAFDVVYDKIERGRELIREGLEGPLTMARQFQEVQEKVDEAEKLVDGLAISLWEGGQMAELLRSERDKGCKRWYWPQRKPTHRVGKIISRR